jgi:hypothetical protein
MSDDLKPPDLQEWVASYGGFQNIPWDRWDELNAEYQARRREQIFASEPKTTKPIEILAEIEADDFCAGLVLRDDKVIEAAPIIGYMKGWSRGRVRDHCTEKGWKAKIVQTLKTPLTDGTP